MLRLRFTFISLFAILIYPIVLGQTKPESIKISDDIHLIKLSTNAYIHVSESFVNGYGNVEANGLIFINGKEALLFDTPWNEKQTSVLINYLSDKMGLKIKGFAPNHFHEDCMGGLALLQKLGIPSYASQKTVDIAREKHLPVPDYAFRDSLWLSLGDKKVLCYYPGAAHTQDNIVVWIPSEKILFAGCMAKAVSSTGLGNLADGDLKSYPATIDRVIARFKDAKIIIPGHGDAGGQEVLAHTRALLK